MCDKDTRSVCAIGISLKLGDSLCVHDREGVSQEGKKIYMDTRSARETCMR